MTIGPIDHLESVSVVNELERLVISGRNPHSGKRQSVIRCGLFGHLHSEVGISRLYADSQKVQLVGIALALPVAANVRNQPVGLVRRGAENGHQVLRLVGHQRTSAIATS